MECCQDLRSATVLISEPRVLDNFVADESSGFRLLLAQALIMGSIRNSDVQGLSTLPEKEVRFWHLSLVHLAVMPRSKMPDTTSPLSLKILLDGKINNDNVPPVAQPVDNIRN